ncbi:MAG: enoyl-CoA hydratase/isomerase family protein, partial [Alicyclobacillaceae bacterium]|nr:enoyl-CoA hydratase/isomerase family protein [Alicyclobacillaceae bacterium]
MRGRRRFSETSSPPSSNGNTALEEGEDVAEQSGAEFRNILYEERGRLAVITVNRPEFRNAINGETLEEIAEALKRARESSCGVVVFTGTGDKAFVAGADIRA